MHVATNQRARRAQKHTTSGGGMPRMLGWLRHAAMLCMVALLGVAGGCTSDATPLWQGYAEGDYTYVASPLGGQVAWLGVARGDTVQAGMALFKLEDGQERAAVAEAQRRLEQARNKLADLRKGSRPSELDALDAQVGASRAALELAGRELRRRTTLLEEGAIAREEYERARTTWEADRERLREARAALTTARLGGREDALAAARAEVEAQEARSDQAMWALTQKTQAAPVAGVVTDTLYQPGSYAPGTRPVVTLLGHGAVFVRFYVPEPHMARVHVGMDVEVLRDGGKPLAARVSRIAPEAEYTPPVIYSSQSRAKLVFMVEARLVADPGGATPPFALPPGLPVDVRPLGWEASGGR